MSEHVIGVAGLLGIAGLNSEDAKRSHNCEGLKIAKAMRLSLSRIPPSFSTTDAANFVTMPQSDYLGWRYQIKQ